MARSAAAPLGADLVKTATPFASKKDPLVAPATGIQRAAVPHADAAPAQGPQKAGGGDGLRALQITPAPVEPARTPVPAAMVSPPKAEIQEKTWALTVRLPDNVYQRLRHYAFSTHQKHQEVFVTALLAHLDREAPDDRKIVA